jgi:hypothetical protein
MKRNEKKTKKKKKKKERETCVVKQNMIYHNDFVYTQIETRKQT